MKLFILRLRQRPRVLVMLDLVQDLDLLLPIAIGIQQHPKLDLQVVATGRVLEQSPRIQTSFAAAGIKVCSVPHQAVLKGALPSLRGVAAIVTATETTAGPHRIARALVLRANKARIATYTLQHGYENIGLNYTDDVYPFEKIQFASEHILIWGDPAWLPAETPAETRQKCIGVGCPKPAQPTQDLPQLHHGRRHLIAIFENLHWERYSDMYRNQMLEDIAAVAQKFPLVTFLIKPHPAGLWLSNQSEDRLPKGDNIWVIDPRLEQWQAYTAPAFIAVADATISTPSTVVLDAARMGKPVAVASYDLPLPNYAPLPCLKDISDWCRFVQTVCSADASKEALQAQAQTFVAQNLIPGDSVARILDRILLDVA